MHCIVTAGPTYETMDNVRRLTNFSTGRLGTELANHLTARGHCVTLLLGEQATYGGERLAQVVESFGTTANLREKFKALSGPDVGAVFHAAAVSDFTFGKIWVRSDSGELHEARAGKISTREGTLMAELVPTPKIIAELRALFPKAKLVGWKYEVDGNRDDVIRKARHQLSQTLTDVCVANGPAYGTGFGLVTLPESCLHLPDATALFGALDRLLPV
jgi:phosphopantothenoylcysteine decarboxylase/phosphopantothenate--cysteine ligase